MKTVSAIALLMLLTSCATIVDGRTQPISVTTAPDKGATCQLKNSEGIFNAFSTPEIVTVKQSNSNMVILCTKDNKSGTEIIESKAKGILWGNVLAGGIIGLGVDMSTGAAYKYPDNINVAMKDYKEEKNIVDLYDESNKKSKDRNKK